MKIFGDLKISSRSSVAFTLAEVLITLAIIGVVAVLVIPAFLNNKNDAELKNMWKKQYAVYSQAITQAMQDNGGNMASVCDNYSHNNCAQTFKQYLRVIKDCQRYVGNGGADCMATNITCLNGASNPAIPISIASSGAVLADGSSFYLFAYWNNTPCTKTSGECAIIYVDVNGYKSPNMFGRDIFGINIFYDSIAPMGSSNDTDGHNELCTLPGTKTKYNTNYTDWRNNGLGCSAKYLYE